MPPLVLAICGRRAPSRYASVVNQVAPSWYERPSGVIVILCFMLVAAWALGSSVVDSSSFYGFALERALLLFSGFALLLTYGTVRRHRHMKRGSLLPLTVISGVVGRRSTGEQFPKYARLLGRLTVSNDGLSWRPLAPRRHPRSLVVPWREVQAIRGWSVEAAGWSNLDLCLSSYAKYVRAAIEECGMEWHRHPWDREVPDVALWAGEQPDWGLVSDDQRIEP